MPSIDSVGAKLVGGFSKLKPIDKLSKQFEKHFDSALVYTTIGSIVVKDGIGCGMYVTQSLNNKEIPEKRRSFVAALDLTNGLLMILTQIGLFLAMHKLNKPLFNWIFRKSFSKDARKLTTTQVRMIQHAEGDSVGINNVSRKNVVRHVIDKKENKALKTFEFLTDLVASTIIGKRIVVPLIATPLASVVEKKMNAKHAALGNKTEDKVKDNSNPSMQGAKKPEVAQKLDLTSVGSTNLLEKYRA